MISLGIRRTYFILAKHISSVQLAQLTYVATVDSYLTYIQVVEHILLFRSGNRRLPGSIENACSIHLPPFYHQQL